MSDQVNPIVELDIPEKPKKKGRIFNVIIKVSWISFLSLFVGFWLFAFSVYWNAFGLFGEIPGFEILENPKSDLASEIYSSDGVMIGKYFSKNRSRVDFDEISKHVIKALIATEDARFVNHSGVDFRATLRIVTSLGSSGGGSTITQQLAKNLFRMRTAPPYVCEVNNKLVKMGAIKVKEWVTAQRLEAAYTKKEIITMYLNTVDFGRGAYGIKAASKIYFNKEPIDLNVQEAAVLVGKLKATSTYDPISHPENALKRRNTVLFQMTKYGNEKGAFLSKEKYDSLKALPLILDYSPESYHSGDASYFRAFVKKQMKSIPALEGYNLSTDGLKIYTTVNSVLQRHAEYSVNEHMRWLQGKFNYEWRRKNPWPANYEKRKLPQTDAYRLLKSRYAENPDSLEYYLDQPRRTTVFTFNGAKDTIMSPRQEFRYHAKHLHAGMVSIDPHSGKIRAWVGGLNSRFFGYDHVHQGMRQVGSTFKPILYSAALNNGYSPCDEFLDAPVTLSVNGRAWTPRRKNPTGEMQTMKWAMAKSINNIAGLVIKKIGPEAVIKHARSLGISTRIDTTVAMALGTNDMKMLELVNAYCVFVDSGYYRTPQFIERIEDKNGKVIYTPEQSIRKVMPKRLAFYMVTMLREGTKIGTSRSLQYMYKLLNKGNQIGGKTGTTQKSADGWFIGISKNLVTGVWVGGEEPSIRFRNGYIGQGAKMALPIFGKYMVSLYNDQSSGIKRGIFPVPKEVNAEDVNCVDKKTYPDFDDDDDEDSL